MGAADGRGGAGRLRHADWASVLRLCRVRPISCSKRLAKTSSAPSRGFSTSTAASRRSPRASPWTGSCYWPKGSPARLPSPMVSPFVRLSKRFAGSTCRRGRWAYAPFSPSSNGCAITRLLSQAFATRQHWQLPQHRPRSSRRPCCVSAARSARHPYLFGVVIPGGVSRDLTNEECEHLVTTISALAERLRDLHQMLRYSSSFLDRLEEVGIVRIEQAIAYGLVGPVARARVWFGTCVSSFPTQTTRTSTSLCPLSKRAMAMPGFASSFRRQSNPPNNRPSFVVAAGRASGRWACFVARGRCTFGCGGSSRRGFPLAGLNEEGTVARYRITPPSFTNWHGFHLAAENFAFQDFPIILASFGLSNAECDR